MKQRDVSIDFMKSILVILMVAAHIVQFFPSGSQITVYFSKYVNLTTFSGFMFTFGFVCFKAYALKDKNELIKRLRYGGGQNSLCLLHLWLSPYYIN